MSHLRSILVDTRLQKGSGATGGGQVRVSMEELICANGWNELCTWPFEVAKCQKLRRGLVVAFWQQPSLLNMAAPPMAAQLLLLSFDLSIAVAIAVAAVP